MLTFRFDGADGAMVESEMLTAGMTGKKVKLEFSEDWSGLSKTAVFIAGDTVRDAVVLSGEAAIPADVLREPLEQLWVGVYGVSADGTVVIPTIRVKGPVIQPGIDPSGDRSSNDPDLPVWKQLQTAVEEMQEDLAAVGSGGYYMPRVTQSDEQTMQIDFTPTGADMPAVDPVVITLPGVSTEDVTDGKDGGYYTITVDQPSTDTARFSFSPSAADMAAIPAQVITLPAGPQGIQGMQGDNGAAGLSIYYSGENVPDGTSEMDYMIDLIESAGRTVQDGDLIVNVHGELFVVTSVSDDLAGAACLGSLRGTSGAAGYTPVKGTDYWTENDKAEIKGYVDEAILGGVW